jgi:hypothetical protein
MGNLVTGNQSSSITQLPGSKIIQKPSCTGGAQHRLRAEGALPFIAHTAPFHKLSWAASPPRQLTQLLIFSWPAPIFENLRQPHEVGFPARRAPFGAETVLSTVCTFRIWHDSRRRYLGKLEKSPAVTLCYPDRSRRNLRPQCLSADVFSPTEQSPPGVKQ